MPRPPNIGMLPAPLQPRNPRNLFIAVPFYVPRTAGPALLALHARHPAPHGAHRASPGSLCSGPAPTVMHRNPPDVREPAPRRGIPALGPGTWLRPKSASMPLTPPSVPRPTAPALSGMRSFCVSTGLDRGQPSGPALPPRGETIPTGHGDPLTPRCDRFSVLPRRDLQERVAGLTLAPGCPLRRSAPTPDRIRPSKLASVTSPGSVPRMQVRDTLE